MKFQVGDKVRVREDLEIDKQYGEEVFVESMVKFKGKTVEIDDVWGHGYNLKKDDENWVFTDEMLEPIEDPLAQKVLERNNKPELVNHPDHYQGNKFEVIDIIEDYELNFTLGSAVKYILRAGKKDDKNTDLKKAIWMLERELEEEE